MPSKRVGWAEQGISEERIWRKTRKVICRKKRMGTGT